MQQSVKDKVWTDTELMAVRAILLIEQNLEPSCDECGYGADRPNCVMGGGCARHEQENVVAYDEVIAQLARTAGLREFRDWRLHYPLDRVVDLSDDEKNLMLDLLEQPDRKLISRDIDNRFTSLRKKGICGLSAQYSKWTTDFTRRGLAWAQKIAAERGLEHQANSGIWTEE